MKNGIYLRYAGLVKGLGKGGDNSTKLDVAGSFLLVSYKQ